MLTWGLTWIIRVIRWTVRHAWCAHPEMIQTWWPDHARPRGMYVECSRCGVVKPLLLTESAEEQRRRSRKRVG